MKTKKRVYISLEEAATLLMATNDSNAMLELELQKQMTKKNWKTGRIGVMKMKIEARRKVVADITYRFVK